MLIAALQTIKSKLQFTLNSSDRRAKIQDGDFMPALLLAVATSRVKASAKLLVIESVHGFGKNIVGKDLLSYPILRKRESVVELLAEMLINDIEVQFRVVGFWDNKSKKYRWYLT